jgi:hypothetical protein
MPTWLIIVLVVLIVLAVGGAIADATGVRLNDLPVTPDRVFAAMEKRRRASPVRGNGRAV